MNTLIVFSRNDVSLDYFRATYGESFDKLRLLPRLSLEVISRTEHEIFREDDAVSMVTDLVCRWARGGEMGMPELSIVVARKLLALSQDTR